MSIALQPLVDVRTARIFGFEALARFDDGRSPEVWLAEADATGRRLELELDLIDQAVRACDIVPDGFVVTFNASAETFSVLEAEHLELSERLRWGIEMSEQSPPESWPAVRRISDDLGCLLVIDDAGTRNATTECILEVHPDIVKLDRSLIQSYSSDADARAQVEALCAAASEVGARTLAEGVEHPGHAALVQDLGIDFAQGYYYGRPELAPRIPELYGYTQSPLGPAPHLFD